MKYNDKVGRANSAKWSEELKDQAVREYDQEEYLLSDAAWLDSQIQVNESDLIRPENN